MSYDKENIFAKILKGEIPCEKVYEDDHVLSFYDVKPQKKIHVLVIPKGRYINLDDFNDRASDEEVIALTKAISLVEKKLSISINNGDGYRALVNTGTNAGQEVPHLHYHLFGGEKIGKMVEWLK